VNLCNLLGTLVSVIIGGLITLGVNLHLQKRERKTQYAIKNKNEIYEPLYNEIEQKLKYLNRFQDPLYPTSTLNSWNEFAPSIKLRISEDLKKIIEKFDATGKRFSKKYSKANRILKKYIGENLETIRNELDESEYNENNFNILKDNIFEGYKGDFYSERILKGIKHNYPPEKIIKFNKGSSMTFDTLFNKICSSIRNEIEIVVLRKIRDELVEITKEMKNYLKLKIEFILNKYESKMTKV